MFKVTVHTIPHTRQLTLNIYSGATAAAIKLVSALPNQELSGAKSE